MATENQNSGNGGTPAPAPAPAESAKGGDTVVALSGEPHRPRVMVSFAPAVAISGPVAQGAQNVLQAAPQNVAQQAVPVANAGTATSSEQKR